MLGVGAINATGNVDANIILGNNGANKLDGQGGDDTVDGGKGNDSYFANSTKDQFSEDDKLGGGVDTVFSTADFELGDNIENLTLTGVADSIGIGNALANILTGNDGANELNGGAGIDKMAGGKGNDLYHVDDSKDVVTEAAAATGGGIDTVIATATFVLGTNVDNLILNGTAANATGNALDNELTGNDEANKLSGLVGNDTLIGSDGADTIDGGTGDDSLSGGNGDDLYIVDSTGDQVTEAGISLGDELRTNQSTLTAPIVGIEHYTFTGTKAASFAGDAADNKITGTAAADSLAGGDGEDVLNGLAGNDTLSGGDDDDRLIGGTGMDSMAGGAGDDTYGIDNAGDKLSELGGDGIDTVESSVAFALGADFENLTLIGNGAVAGTGNGLGNAVFGNSAANTLSGLDGNDTIAGGGGNDTVIGGGGDDSIDVGIGNDTVRYTSLLDGRDVIENFDGDSLAGGQDVLNLDALFDSLAIAAGGRAARVQLIDSGPAVEVWIDTTGDAIAETQIAILNTNDFISIGTDVIVGT